MEISPQDEELKAHLLQTDSNFRELCEQHAQLKQQVEEMESRHVLSEEDEMEEQRLKKLKLHVKDQILEIIDSHRHASVQ